MKKNTVKKAVAKMEIAHMNTAQKVKYARDTHNTATASSVFQSTPQLQTSMTAWQAATDALDQNQSDISKTEGLLTTLRQKEVNLVFNYEVTAASYGGVAQATAKGDPSVVAGLGLALKSPPMKPVEIGAPLGLQIHTSKAGVESLVWDKVLGARLYVMQISTDPATDASWTTVQGGGRKRKLTGLVHGQKYLLRVKALGATLESPWSAVLGITAK